MRPDGFVLAGGRSQRMGVDKARIPFPARRPMAVEVASRLWAVCDRVALVRRAIPDPLPWPSDLEVIRDRAPEGDAHPLWGVAAALEAARTEVVLVVPCDHPWIDEASLLALIGSAPAVARGPDGLHPLLCALTTQMAPAALEAARTGASARSFASACAEVTLSATALRDLDRWEDSGRPGPIRELLDGLPWLNEDARARVAAGERGRLAGRGMIDPGDC